MDIEPIEGAFSAFESKYTEINDGLPTIVSEQDTRLKIIDPIFTDVLGWPMKSVATEEPTGDGFVDYKFSIDGMARLIVEAKRDSVSLGLKNRNDGRPYKLNGPVLKKNPQPRDGILQAVRYCGSKNAELACVTNGNEWIIFRGSRLGDGKDTLDGMAFVFTNLEAVKNNFTFFYDLLSYEKVSSFLYRAFFQEAEGQPIRAKRFSKTLRAVDSYSSIPKSELANDVERVMAAFFRRLSGDDDPDMLYKCFVTTKESQIADESIFRVTSELSNSIRSLETDDASALTQVIKRVNETKRNEFILLVGTKGAGKSTFTDRFFRYVLPSELASECLVIRIDISKFTGDKENVIKWLNAELLSEIERKLFSDSAPSYDEIQGMFFDEYTRWMRGSFKHLYESDKIQFKINFGNHIEEIRSKDKEKYIMRQIRHIILSRKKVPCLIFDNTDHFSIDFQEKVFQYARSIYENEMCLVLIPITDKTSWQLSQQGALQSFDNQSFYLPTPQSKKVFETRIAYLEEQLATEKREKGRNYFVGKGINLSLDNLQGFVSSLEHIFLETGEVSQWVEKLTNNDVRRSLTLVRHIVVSPYIKIDELVKSYLSGSSIRTKENDIKRAIIRGGFNIYPTGQNQYVQNIFALNTEVESTPILGLRILRLLRDAKHHDSQGIEDYVSIEQIIDYFQAIGIERIATTLSIDSMLKSGLCLAHDPTVTKVAEAKKIQLSPSGLQHMLWGGWDETYIGSMLIITPITNDFVFDKLKTFDDLKPYEKWINQVIVFIEYLLREDNIYTQSIDHKSYKGQEKLLYGMNKKVEKLKKQLGV